MGKKKKQETILVGDFETTVYDGQTSTEVWASAVVELNTEDVQIHHSIDETFKYLLSLNKDIIIYYHNLKFDGSFWLQYILKTLQLKPAYEPNTQKYIKKQSEMPNDTFSVMISDKGQWYGIKIMKSGHIIDIRDSLKLLPFSVKTIGKSFGTKHHKLEMEYKGKRYAGCMITDEEKEYIANDVLVVKEALEIMYAQGHTGLTIGSCCLKEFKDNCMGAYGYQELFPNLYDLELVDKYESKTVGDYIRASYRGGWCYVKKGIEGKIQGKGLTADVNSLYPSMMHSESGNYFPIGNPTMWYGNYIPKKATLPERYYFIRIRCRFKIKDGYLPFIQIKGSGLYRHNEMLETSDILMSDGKYYRYYTLPDGTVKEATVELTLTQTDYQLLHEHYNVYDEEIISGCWFYAQKGIFDQYINTYRKIKENSKGAIRQLAKLFLNNLYGKFASSQDSSYKIPYIKSDGALGYESVFEQEKTPGYIAVGSAITSYAREFTIRAAQANYSSFRYADTDSIHCETDIKNIKAINIHPTNFCCWKIESYWDTAIFVRQKTYIEHVTHEDQEPVDKPYYDIKCAGMPQRCKDLFNQTLQPKRDSAFYKKCNKEEKEFLKNKYTLSDFKVGLKVPSKLMPRNINGGILLVSTSYEMR